MGGITDVDLAAIRSAIARRRRQLEAHRLTVETRSDLDHWAAIMAQAPKALPVSPNLDPARGDVRPGNAYWIAVREPAGTVVATMVEKLYVTNDLLYDIRSHRFFYDSAPRLDDYPITLHPEARVPSIAGRVSYGGGLWVHPDWRGKSLGNTLPQIGRYLNLRQWLIDFHVSLIATSPNRDRWSSDGVRNAHQTPLMTGLFPVSDTERNISLHWNTREEILEEVRTEAASMVTPDSRASRTSA